MLKGIAEMNTVVDSQSRYQIAPLFLIGFSLFSLLLAGTIKNAFAETSDEEKSGFHPYHTASQYIRDLLNDEPLPPVKIMTDPYVAPDVSTLSGYNFSRAYEQLWSIPLEMISVTPLLLSQPGSFSTSVFGGNSIFSLIHDGSSKS